MNKPLKILHLEDNGLDAELIWQEMRASGWEHETLRVQTEAEFREALRRPGWDLILSDYRLPDLDGLVAVDIARELAPDVPIILVSGTMGEEAAISGLQRGAIDFVLKNRLTRLGPVIKRALNEHDSQEQQRGHEATILRQNRQLKALREIDITIIESLDVRLTASMVLKQVRSELKVDAGALLIRSRDDATLDYVIGVGFNSTDVITAQLRMGEGYAGRAAQTRKNVFIRDLRETSGVFIESHHLGHEGFVSYMAVPLIAKGRVEGVLELFHRELLEPSEEWHEFLEALAGQTAIAIDNAELYSNLEKANTGLRQAYDQTLEGWVHALDIRDEETEGHSRRVTETTVKLALMANIPHAELVHVRRGALLHDIGKLGIPDSILLKPGKLTDEEWTVMRKHPVYAFEWLAPIGYLKPALDIPYCHHEKWDGTGYPRGLRGEVIPLSARLFAVVDVWDALRSDRPYRKAWEKEKVLDHIKSLSGTHFDPVAAEMFLKLEL